MFSQKLRLLFLTILLSPLFGFGQALMSNLKEAIENPKAAVRLDLSGQNVHEISSSLKKMKGLRYLDLSHNQIDTIPPLLLNLKNLDTLIISHNSIEHLPPKLCFSNLYYIDVRDNPIRSRSYRKCYWTKSWQFLWGELDPAPELIEQEDQFIIAETQPEMLNQQEIINQIKSQNDYQKTSGIRKVLLRIQVDRGGKYVDHRVLQSDDDELLAFLEASLRDMRFMPAFNKGKPLTFWINVPFEF